MRGLHGSFTLTLERNLALGRGLSLLIPFVEVLHGPRCGDALWLVLVEEVSDQKQNRRMGTSFWTMSLSRRIPFLVKCETCLVKCVIMRRDVS